MERFKQLINVNELDILLGKEKLSEEDLIKISSITPNTLVGAIGDLKNEELREVYYLEEKNIYKVLNTVAMLLGIFGKEYVDDIMKIPEIVTIGLEIRKTANSKEIYNASFFFLCAKYLLSLDMQGVRNSQLKPIFDGKVPKKMFALRQTAAEIWFADYTEFVLTNAAKLYSKRNFRATFLYVVFSIAWYLNKSQTFKYYQKSTDKDMNETLTRITKEFVTIMDGNALPIINNLSVPLYKDL